MKENDEQTDVQPLSSLLAQNQTDNDPLRERVVSTFASFLTQGKTDDRFEIFLNPLDPAPALVCFFNLEAFRRHFRNLWLFVKAFGETCQRLNVEFDPTTSNVKAWEKFQQQRPDIAEKALLLTRDPDFLLSFAEEAATFAEHYMQFIDPERIMNSVGTGIDLLNMQAKENTLTAIYEARGDERRGTQDKHRSAQKIVRQFDRNQMGLKNGRNGVKSKDTTRCTYEKLEQAVCALCSKTDWEDDKLPDKKLVAARIGFKGANRDQTLGAWMRNNRDRLIQNHKHSTYKFRQVAKEILEKHYSKPKLKRMI